MEFRLLGPFEVVVAGQSVPLDAAKPRALLVLLLLRVNEPVSCDLLVEQLWAGQPPSSARKVVQTYVSQLRGVLGPGVIRTVSSAYELRVDPESVDVYRFEELRRDARTAAPPEANGIWREALALWRGPALVEFAYESWAQREIDRLEELRLEALQERIETDLAVGASAELVGELELLVGEYPLRERLRAQLMLALYRSGRQADALAAYRDARRALVDALGIEPTLALRQLERRILDQDPTLDLVDAGPAPGGAEQPRPTLRDRSSSFVGRTRELREIREILRGGDVRLLTLTGAAGSGKTRLARELMSAMDGEAGDAVLVELARINDARLVARTIAGELGVKERSGQSARQALLEFLQGRQTLLLLLLDNFEHVLSAAPLARELAGAPGVRVLVTSRAPLDVPEERVFPVPALELPDLTGRDALARLRRAEAVRLFVDRARAARPDFELSETNARSVAELCVRLDGLPLALELAAARCNLLSPAALLERLDSRLDLLRAAPGSGVSERQRTLRAAIEWSYDLLRPRQQQLFTSLGVFVGGFTLAAAELVADQPELDIVDGVESLLRNNLLTTVQARGDEPRLGMLETIREYALERLVARGDGEAVRRRHADFYLMLAEEAEPGLRGPDQREWLDRLDADRDNISAALTWAIDAGEGELGLRIGSALWRFWQLRSSVQEARERLEELLALGSGSTTTRATAQTELANLMILQGDPETARRLLEESLSVHRRNGDAYMIAHTVGLLSRVALSVGEIDSALARARQAVEAARGGRSPYVESNGYWLLGVCLAEQGELDDAERTLEEALDLLRKLGNTRSIAGSLISLGGLAVMRGDHDRARPLFDEGLGLYRSLDDRWGISISLSNIAFLALEEGDAESACVLLTEALAIERHNGDHPSLARTLEMSARLAAGGGHPALSIRLYAQAALPRFSGGSRPYELGFPDPMLQIAELRSRVGEATFEEEWERGRAMSILEAIDQASEALRALEPGLAPSTDEGRIA